jgi:hypothetical protein
MPDFDEINRLWVDAIRAHANTPLVDDEGLEYRAIGKRSLNFLGDAGGRGEVRFRTSGA